MQLEKTAAIAEIVSSIAIVLTLIYLAIQTQQLGVQTEQNTSALQASARQAALDADLRILAQIIERPFLYAGPPIEMPDSDFTEEELIQIAVLTVSQFRARESYWIHHEAGALDSNVWESYRTALIRRLSSDAASRYMWDLFSDQLDPGFAGEIDGLLVDE